MCPTLGNSSYLDCKSSLGVAHDFWSIAVNRSFYVLAAACKLIFYNSFLVCWRSLVIFVITDSVISDASLPRNHGNIEDHLQQFRLLCVSSRSLCACTSFEGFPRARSRRSVGATDVHFATYQHLSCRSVGRVRKSINIGEHADRSVF